MRKRSKRLQALPLATACLAAIALVAPLNCAQASKAYSVLYAFCQQTGCADGSDPVASLVADKAGNLYGTTSLGGANASGSIFEITPSGTESVLYSFCAQANCADGSYPDSTLIRDKAGNLYGTTANAGGGGGGTVFKLTPGGTYSVLYSFCSVTNCLDGDYPEPGVVMDGKGNLYGVTGIGGAFNYGTVFELAPNGTESVLHSFGPPNTADGLNPQGGLIRDGKGNLYGTTAAGGANYNCTQIFGTCGTVFEISAKGGYTVRYAFCPQTACSDGAIPLGALVEDKGGNLYGTTSTGGLFNCSGAGCGTVFELAPNGAESVLYTFCPQTPCSDGSSPKAGLLAGTGGVFYGTTAGGGTNNLGTVFELAGTKETVLHSFDSKGSPDACLISVKGHLYGTATETGTNGGEVFKFRTLGGHAR